jgi:hypothetical protein
MLVTQGCLVTLTKATAPARERQPFFMMGRARAERVSGVNSSEVPSMAAKSQASPNAPPSPGGYPDQSDNDVQYRHLEMMRSKARRRAAIATRAIGKGAPSGGRP